MEVLLRYMPALMTSGYDATLNGAIPMCRLDAAVLAWLADGEHVAASSGEAPQATAQGGATLTSASAARAYV